MIERRVVIANLNIQTIALTQTKQLVRLSQHSCCVHACLSDRANKRTRTRAPEHTHTHAPTRPPHMPALAHAHTNAARKHSTQTPYCKWTHAVTAHYVALQTQRANTILRNYGTQKPDCAAIAITKVNHVFVCICLDMQHVL